MNIRQRIANRITPSASNSMGQDLARSFMKYGNKKPLVQDWSQVIMSDKESYSGFLYAAINNRANGTAQMAENNLITTASPSVMKAAKSKDEQLIHPYLTVIDESDEFSNYDFWYNISTYLDLEGVYYLMAVRNVQGDRTGAVQSFELLNPYEIRRIRNKDTLEIGGYVEAHDGLIREIPKEMIIEMRELNPFSRDDPYALTDAAKDSQFTMKQASDYTKHSLKNNMAAPGIISTDVMLEEEVFKNFVARVTSQEKGLPLFGNGGGAITWDSMQIEMDKAALDKVNEINLNGVIAVTGNSKTMFGIEQSGVTRDTAKVQRDLFIQNHIIPQLQLIVDALNQDYKKYYKSEYSRNGYKLTIDNPLRSDKEAEMKEVEVKTKNFDLYNSLVNKGYEPEIAAKYCEGNLTLVELGEPTRDPILPVLPGVTPPTDQDDEEDQEDQPTTNQVHDHNEHIAAVKNALADDQQGIVNQQQGLLENAVVNIEGQLISAVLNKVTKNQFDSQSDIISDEDRKQAEDDLELIVAAFYAVIIPLYASTVLNRRASEFQEFTNFKMNNEVKSYINANANRAAASHINTVLDEILKTIQETNERFIQQRASQIVAETGSDIEEAIKLAQKEALDGKSRQQIISSITEEYNQISRTRAKTIARTETNRAFTMSQYEADKQFIKQNGYEGRAYKRWITRSAQPCNFCLAKAAEPPIPFNRPFADLGDVLETTYTKENGQTGVRKLPINYETVDAGTLHPNCACTYQLIIEQEPA